MVSNCGFLIVVSNCGLLIVVSNCGDLIVVSLIVLIMSKEKNKD